MKKWGAPPTKPQDGYYAKNALVFPPLSGEKLTKRQLEEAKLASMPLDLSFSSEIGNQDHNLSSVEHNLSSASDDKPLGTSTVDVPETVPQEHNFQSASAVPDLSSVPSTVNKDWSPADDKRTCPQLASTDSVGGQVLAQHKRRLECFTELGEDEKLPEPDTTTVAQKPDSSCGKGTISANCLATKNPAQGSTTSQSESGTANLNITTGDGKPETTTVAQKPVSSADCWSTKNPAQGSTTTGAANPNATTSGSSSETPVAPRQHE